MNIPHERLLEFERCVLGAILLNNGVLDDATVMMEGTDFVSANNRIIFETMVMMYGEAKPIDLLTLNNELQRGKLDSMIGFKDVAGLTEAVPTAANVKYYIDQVVLAGRRRRLLLLARKAQNDLESGDDETDVIDGMEQALVDIASGRVSHGYVPAHVSLTGAANRLERIGSHLEEIWCAKTGIRPIDKMLGGLESEDYMVIGARPSVGKSAIALQMALNMVGDQKKSVAFFTLEMSDRALMMRAISQHLRIDSSTIRFGRITETDMSRVINYGAELSKTNLYINDTPNIRLSELRAQSRTIKMRHGLDVIFVDYLTLVKADSRLPRWEQVTAVSGAMKELARELEVAVVVLSQLGRDSENKKPTLASLRESGAIEQDADIVLLLHRLADPVVDNMGTVQPTGVEIILAKNRNGSVGRVNMLFIPQYTRFEERENSYDQS